MVSAIWKYGLEGHKEASKIREEVFIKELAYPEQVLLDEYDAVAQHVLVYEDGIGPIASGRLVFLDLEAVISRIAVYKESRGRDIGDLVFRMLLYKALQLPVQVIRIKVRCETVVYFEKFGFKTEGALFELYGHSYISMRADPVKVQFPSTCLKTGLK